MGGAGAGPAAAPRKERTGSRHCGASCWRKPASKVLRAQLLGFTRSACLRGPRAGLGAGSQHMAGRGPPAGLESGAQHTAPPIGACRRAWLPFVDGRRARAGLPAGPPLRPVLPDRRSEEAPGRSRRVYRTAVWLTFLTRSGRNGRKACERGRGRVRGPTLRAVGLPAVMVTVATACRASRRGAAKRPGFPGAAAEPGTAEHGRREPRRAAAAGRRGKPVTRMPADLRAR